MKWMKKIFSEDHKVIGKQYFFTSLFMALDGSLLSLLMRLQLGWPGKYSFPVLDKIFPNGFSGGVMRPEFYLSLVTMHGTIMVFFFLSMAWSGFGNYFIPLMVGAEDMAFPFLNMLSYWTAVPASIIMLGSLFLPTDAAASGWTAYPPLSAVPLASSGSGLGQDLWIIGMALFIVSFTMGSLNFITTILQMRTKGMTFLRLPLVIWTFLFANLVGLLAFPPLVAAALLLLADRHLGTSFYLPSGLVVMGHLMHRKGGTPLLWEHLFWFLGHPEVYVLVFPALGIAFEVFAAFTRKPPFGYMITLVSFVVISFLSLIVWGHHMFISGMNPYLGEFFSIATLAITIPFSVVMVNLLASLWGGKLIFKTPMLFALGFLSTMGVGGLTGLFLGNAVSDIEMHNTYFVVAHFHFTLLSAALFGVFAGTYFWFPKMFGKMMNETLGKIHFYSTLILFYCVFFPMFYLGFGGMMRHLYDPTQYAFLKPLQPINLFISICAFLLFGSQLIFLFNFFYSLARGEKAPENPWECSTLEWQTSSPPPHGNWKDSYPVVYRWAYDYEKGECVPQTVPESS